MTLEYNLSKDIYLDFQKKFLPKTTYYKYAFLNIFIIYFLLIILAFLTKKLVGIIATIIVLIALLIAPKRLSNSYLKKSIRLLNSSPILIGKQSLNLDENLTVSSKYETFEIPFSEISSIFISKKYILLISSNTKDILIPHFMFNKEIFNQDNFLSYFKDTTINYSFPKKYNFF